MTNQLGEENLQNVRYVPDQNAKISVNLETLANEVCKMTSAESKMTELGFSVKF